MKLLGFTLAGLAAAGVHEERQAQIDDIVQTEGVLWRAAAHPRFAASPPGASARLCGVKAGWREQILAAVQRGDVERFEADENLAIPSEFDSAAHWPQCAKIIGDIRDQSNCGCCWAFAGAEAASDRMCIATNGSVMLPLSAEDVCFCAESDGCDGGMVLTPWDFIRAEGAVTGGQYRGTGPFGKGLCSNYALPHCHHHGPKGDDPYPAEGEPGCPHAESPQCPKTCDGGAMAEHSDFTNDKYNYKGRILTASGERSIQHMIMKGGPVETAFNVYSDFENYAGGIYHHVKGGMAGGHAVKFVGWGVENGAKYWKVANSWNPYWGEGGYFRIRRGNNEGGIEDQVVGASHLATWGKMNAATVVV